MSGLGIILSGVLQLQDISRISNRFIADARNVCRKTRA
jgi:hypothetical protein